MPEARLRLGWSWSLAALLCVVLALAGTAQAQPWPGLGSGMVLRVEVEIPAHALPPGPASLRLLERPHGAIDHSVRFTMPQDGPITLPLWVEYGMGADLGEERVLVKGVEGSEWRGRTGGYENNATSALFVGAAEELAVINRAVEERFGRELGDMMQGRGGLEIAPSSLSGSEKLDCRALASRTLVLVTAPGLESELSRCAAMGAWVILLSPEGEGLGGSGAGSLSPYGNGVLAWALDRKALAKLAGEAMTQTSRSTGGTTWPLQTIVYEYDQESWGKDGDVLWMEVVPFVLLYVLCLGLLGWAIHSRPRRAILAWTWFPALALAVVLASTVFLILTRVEPSLDLRVWHLAAPDGQGFRLLGITPRGQRRQPTELQLSWRDGDLSPAWDGMHLAGPFSRSIGPLTLDEDQIHGRARVSGIRPASGGAAAVQLLQPELAPVPHLEARPEGLVLVNPLKERLERVLVTSGMAWTELEGMAAETERPLTLDQAWGEGLVPDAWANNPVSQLSQMDPRLFEGPDSYMLLAHVQLAASPLESLEPKMEQIVRSSYLVLGPMPQKVAQPRQRHPRPSPAPQMKLHPKPLLKVTP